MNLVAQASERAVRGQQTVDEALASLDKEVDAVLEKRRWMMSQKTLTASARQRP